MVLPCHGRAREFESRRPASQRARNVKDSPPLGGYIEKFKHPDEGFSSSLNVKLGEYFGKCEVRLPTGADRRSSLGYGRIFHRGTPLRYQV